MEAKEQMRQRGCESSNGGAASRFFAGSSEHVRLGVANLHSLKGNAISYDQSCLGPCVG